MQTIDPSINLDVLVEQLVELDPKLASNGPQATVELRSKLHEQLVLQVPHVELEHLDLKCIIMNVKKSLWEFQKRIDDSVAQQQLRRTARVRKSISQDPAVISFFNQGIRNDRKHPTSTGVKLETACNGHKCCHKMPDFSDLVQVESLPVSATTNLLTIFVPSILQEKMNSCKYKISIDLNRLDLTKQILDVNLEHRVKASLDTKAKDEALKVSIDTQTSQICQTVVPSGREINAEKRVSVETQTSDVESETKPQLELIPEINNPPKLEATVFIQTEDPGMPTNSGRGGKKRGPKRKEPKPPSSDPPKKRGRKPGSKNKNKKEKSDLAKYVEMFACNTGSPSAVSQIVTSTTQNWDIAPDETGQITYFMNGQWTVNNEPNVGRQLVSTTNGNVCLGEGTTAGQDAFIPFEDFVNFIENPSLDSEHNVIARVLDDAVNAGQSLVTMQESQSINSCVGEPAQRDMEIETTQPSIPTSSAVKDQPNVAHSTAPENSEAIASGGNLDLSSDCTLPLTLDILDLTQRRIPQPISPLQSVPPCVNDNNEKEKSIVFSTGRNMPLLDMEADIFCSTPQQVDAVDNTVVFSVAPRTSQSSPICKQNSAEGDSNVDSAIEMEGRGTLSTSSESPSEAARNLENISTPIKERTMPEAMKGMSLLEIEKDIDDSLLDFDTYADDDLLSLAPSSCFNSPNPADDVQTPMCIQKSPPVENCAEASLPQRSEDHKTGVSSKNFKIPRKIITSETTPVPQDPLTTITSKQSGQEVKLISTVAPVVPRNGAKSPVSSRQSNIKVEPATMRDVAKLFGPPLCYGFLSDKCFLVSCRFSHQLLDCDIIKNSLSHLRVEDLNSAYRYIWRHYKLFYRYFVVFCHEYALRNMRHKLASMINDCEMQPLCLPYLRNIYSSLIASGLNKVNACRFILSHAKARSHIAIDILLEIIIESGAVMFATTIAQLAEIPNYKFRMKDINEMATVCLRSGNTALTTVLIKCLISVDQTEFVTMRSTELVQILELIKDGNFGRL